VTGQKPKPIPLNDPCPKCGHANGRRLAWCMGAPLVDGSRMADQQRIRLLGGQGHMHRRGLYTLAGCEREGEHVHRWCTVCWYDQPVDPVDLDAKVVGQQPARDPGAALVSFMRNAPSGPDSRWPSPERAEEP